MPVGAPGSQSVAQTHTHSDRQAVRPWAPGFRAEAHTISGPASVWAGELRPSLAEATADAIAMIDELRLTG